MGITLDVATKHLKTWLDAELAVATGQSYTIGERTLTRANLSEIRKSIEYWENKVNSLESFSSRNMIHRAVPIDI